MKAGKHSVHKWEVSGMAMEQSLLLGVSLWSCQVRLFQKLSESGEWRSLIGKRSVELFCSQHRKASFDIR
jgi:hypothetical protein